MKLIGIIAALFTSAAAFAQQAPNAVQMPPSFAQIPPRARLALPPAAAPPSAPTPSAPFGAPSVKKEDELAKLLNAQTEAIKALTAKVDTLDERLRKIENGGR
jgi:hypothetical protein